MCDFEDEYDGEYHDYGEEGFCEDDFEGEVADDLDAVDDDFGDRSIENDAECDDFSGRDAFFIGSAMGWAYEEGLQDGSRQQRKRKP